MRERTLLIRNEAAALGFDLCGIAPAVSPPGYHRLIDWLRQGYHADMDWMPRRETAYQHPDGILPGTRSVIALAVNYHNRPADQPEADQQGQGSALSVARYARGVADYHDLLRLKLRRLTNSLTQFGTSERHRIVIDTAPMLEREFAKLAGIGWFGKNTMLINRSVGSWTLLSFILTTLELEYDEPHQHDYCGTCTACLDACPTDAFPEPGVLDARQCIAYWTIEARDRLIPDSIAERSGTWVFGCDVCQEVCPWNRFAPPRSWPEFQESSAQKRLTSADWLSLTEDSFRELFRGTPLERTGRSAIVRNAIVATANADLKEHLPILMSLRFDASELVRTTADWAINRLASKRQ